MERGNPPRLNPIFAEVFSRLEQSNVEVVVRFPEDELVSLDRLTVDADLYCLKSDTEMALSLATALDGIGARFINSLDATLLAKDKVTAAYVLARAGISAPSSLAAKQSVSLADHVGRGPLILKPPRGYHGAGIKVVHEPDEFPDNSEYPEFVFAQEYLAGARHDLKIYAIGDQIFGVRKAFSRDSYLDFGSVAALRDEILQIARACGRAFGLDLYGLDIGENDAGAYVVDVNYFPGYRGVPNAAGLLSDFLVGALKGGGTPCQVNG